MARTTKPTPPSRPRSSCSSATGRPRPPARRCPVGPPASTSPTRARSRPSAAAARIAQSSKRRSPRSTPRRSSAPGRRRRRSPRPSACGCDRNKGLLECDFGEWTGAELKDARQAARVAHRAALPERLPLPGRRVVHRDADPHHRRRSAGLRRAHPGETIVAVSHADPIKAAVAARASAPTSTCSSASSSRRARSAPSGTPPAARSCSPSTPPATTSPRWACPDMSTSFDFPAPDLFTAGADRRAGRARLLPPGPRRPATSSACGSRSSRWPRWASTSPASSPTSPPRRARCPPTLELIEPVVAEWIVGSLAVAYEEADDRIVLVAEELVRRRRRRGRADDRRAVLARRDAPSTARFRAHPRARCWPSSATPPSS